MKKILLALIFLVPITIFAATPPPINVPLSWNGTNFSATGTPQLTVGNIVATSTTATSTFANGISLSAGCLTVASKCVNNFASTHQLLAYKIATWGDSLTAGSGGTPYPTQLQNLITNPTIYNGGVAGYTSTQIKTLMLAATDKLAWTQVIWSGTNNNGAPTTVKSDIAAMIAGIPGPSVDKRYVIITPMNYYNDPTSNANIITLSADLAALYPGRVINAKAILEAAYNPGVPQDVTDVANDLVPSTLRSDSVVGHLNTAGYLIIAQAVATAINALNNANKVNISSTDIGSIFTNPPAIGTAVSAPGYFSTLSASTTSTGTTTLTGALNIIGQTGTMASYLHTNYNTITNSTLLNPGVSLYDAGGNSFGFDLGNVGGTYRSRIYTSQAFSVAKVVSGGQPASQSDFSDIFTVSNNGNVTMTGTLSGAATTTFSGALRVDTYPTILGYTNVNGRANADSSLLDGGILLYDNGANSFGLDLGYNGGFRTRLFTGSSQDISFAKISSGGSPTGQSSFTELAVIKNNGNFGIGNVSPSYLLDVSGPGHFTGLVDATNFVATSTTATSTFAGGVYFSRTASSSVPYIYSKTSGFGGALIMEDEGGGACTEITTKAGVVKAAVKTCPPEL